jgi:hypothetical protein
MRPRQLQRTLRTIVPAVVIGVALAGGSAHAIVPPKNCGTIKVSHKKWQIKADQIRCTTARKYATTYIAHHTRPRGYSCHKFSGSALYAKCVNTKANPDRTIFIIKK